LSKSISGRLPTKGKPGGPGIVASSMLQSNKSKDKGEKVIRLKNGMGVSR
jgi:hypothetical protein